MKTMKLNKPKLLGMLLVVSMLTLVACGGDEDDSTTVIVDPNDPQQQQQEEEGPISTQPTVIVNNNINNSVVVRTTNTRIERKTVFFNWQCRNVAPVVHQQFIHISVRCPTQADDTNGDGVVDQVEVQQAIGPRVLALDENVASGGSEEFPSGSSYTYNQSVPLEQLRQSVPAGQDFVVMYHGVDADTQLPSTYTTTTGEPAHLTVPIACKVFNAPDIIVAEDETTTGGTATGGTATGGTATGGTATGGTTTGGTTTGGTTTGGTTTGGTTTGGTTTGDTPDGPFEVPDHNCPDEEPVCPEGYFGACEIETMEDGSSRVVGSCYPNED